MQTCIFNTALSPAEVMREEPHKKKWEGVGRSERVNKTSWSNVNKAESEEGVDIDEKANIEYYNPSPSLRGPFKPTLKRGDFPNVQ